MNAALDRFGVLVDELAREGGPPALAEVKCIQRRVDGLSIAFQVDISPAAKQELERRNDLAKRVRVNSIELELGGFLGQMQRAKRPDWFFVQNAHVRAVIDLDAPGGWTVLVTVGAPWLARFAHSPEASLVMAREVASAFGIVKGERLRRFDLCADFVNFPLSDEDMRVWVMPKGAKKMTGFVPCDDKDEDEVRRAPYNVASVLEKIESANDAAPATQQWRDARLQVTGITVCPGNTVMLRVYNKSAELKLSGREEKRSLEVDAWSKSGEWTGKIDSKGQIDGEEVVRVEFQLRNVVLDDMSLRSPQKMIENIDAVWKALVGDGIEGGWTRMVTPLSSSRRSRCPLDRRWSAVQRVRFREQQAPIHRRRRRGGATWEQGFGAMLSNLAGAGFLGRYTEKSEVELLNSCIREVETVDEETGEKVTSHIEDQEVATNGVIQLTGNLAMSYWMRFYAHALGRGDPPSQVFRKIVTQVFAARARFATAIDDNETVHRYEVRPHDDGGFVVALGPPEPAPACGWYEHDERLGIQAAE